MKKKRGSKAATKNLLPTNARYCFYDPLQQQTREPRKGGIRLQVAGTTVPCASAEMNTATLQAVIDEFTTEVLRRAFAGEDEAVDTFALKVSNLVRWLQDLTHRQREKIQQVAARAPFWPVNVTQRDTDFTWAKKYVRDLKVGSKSLLPAKIRSRIARHEPFARLAERLWLQLLKNRHELPDLIKRSASENARKLKSKWISLCLSLAAVKTSQEVTAQDAPKWWKLGEALLLEAWENDRQSAFGAVLHSVPKKRLIRSRAKQKGAGALREVTLTDASMKKQIFKRIESAFRQLLKSGMSPAR